MTRLYSHHRTCFLALAVAAVLSFSTVGLNGQRKERPVKDTSLSDQGAGVTVSHGFMNGNDYLGMDEGQKSAYAMGVINGMLAAPLLGSPENKLEWLIACTVNMGDKQVAAIITKYLRDNPGQWHYGMAILSYNAMWSACPKPNKNP